MLEGHSPKQENVENKSYSEFLAAEAEVVKVLGNIDHILSTSKKEDAEQIILEQWAPRLDTAMEKSKLSFEKWLAELKKSE